MIKLGICKAFHPDKDAAEIERFRRILMNECSDDELLAIGEEARWSRRRFLGIGGTALLTLAMLPWWARDAKAANRTAWTSGNGQGLTWGTAINSSDLASMPTGDTVLSTVADIANGTALDQFMDLSAICTIASSTIAAGANLAFWLYVLQEDGATYGDGQLTAGTQAAKTPTFTPVGVMPLVAAATQTTLVGFIQGIALPPGSFRNAMQNNSGFSLTSGTQTCKFRTYNIALNN